ncbi:hypothetical protein EIB75_13105 [Epilithonimonas vandammei]|uniref:RHS repeat protein n=1 Tax=Epilithonimonas vandammei TaxID=2487072 RepID=A0A3G8ZFZ3_9FLAO|nr:hypothetical protein [Epilithonimonas vandammei]AZI56138.1 hypothetical protein EIB75_13105 [Epilithonimonas vandammei]
MHKDYLGSVLAITDESGNIVEQRHYDAWGQFTHLKVGNGAIITDKDAILNLSKDLIIDRGYTSHEHLNEVGLIHMNGRLYDPALRRFLIYSCSNFVVKKVHTKFSNTNSYYFRTSSIILSSLLSGSVFR